MSRAAEQAMAASYKALKEDFVSNLTGGKIGEINYVTAVAPVRFCLASLYLLPSSGVIIADSCKGSNNPLVHPAIPPILLHALYAPCIHNRLSPQRLRHPARHHALLLHTSASQCFTPRAPAYPLLPPSSAPSEETQTTFLENERCA